MWEDCASLKFFLRMNMALTLCLKIKYMEDRPRMFLKIRIFQENDQEKAILWHLLNFKMKLGYHLYLRPPMEKKKTFLFSECVLYLVCSLQSTFWTDGISMLLIISNCIVLDLKAGPSRKDLQKTFIINKDQLNSWAWRQPLKMFNNFSFIGEDKSIKRA